MARAKTGLRRRGGFTLVELLVVISIIGMLMALLLPAVQQAREAGRRNTCLNNMKNCMFATLNFEGQRKYYPGYCDTLTLQASGASSSNMVFPVSWVVQILPLLERNDIYTLWRNQTAAVAASGAGGVSAWPPQIYMDILNCPSSPPGTKSGATPCVYVANSGMMDLPGGNGGKSVSADWQANGVFFNRFNAYGVANAAAGANAPTLATSTLGVPQASLSNNGNPLISTSQDYISAHDGTSMTLMLSENNNVPLATYSASGTPPTTSALANMSGSWGSPNQSVTGFPSAGLEQTNCFVWWPDSNPAPQMKINGSLLASGGTPPARYDYYMQPASNHPTAVNVAFCDGHARNISQDIDYTVFSLLMTPWGQQCNTPGYTGGLDTGGAANGTTYYPNGVNYTRLRTMLVDDAQVN